MSDDRVATAPCGCGIFQAGASDTIKVHDDKCEFAAKKAHKEAAKPAKVTAVKAKKK